MTVAVGSGWNWMHREFAVKAKHCSALSNYNFNSELSIFRRKMMNDQHTFVLVPLPLAVRSQEASQTISSKATECKIQSLLIKC
jgi:hypothetical protein